MTPITVLVSVDSNSILLGAREFSNYMRELVSHYGLDSLVTVLETVSLGSYNGVVVHVLPDDVHYSIRNKEQVRKIVEEHLLKGRQVWDLVVDKTLIKPAEKFELKETRIVMRNIGVIDPKNIQEYIARDGYFALSKALRMKPEDVIEEIKESGLRGRGGAGFPAGLKWEFTAKATGNQKYVVCNADEGEPGTFKDRLIMEGDPHTVIEGMIIAGYAIGATKGYIYIRGEYYNSVDNLRKAIQDAYEYGFLGENILGSGFNFDLTIRLGAGAYICGEETALLESIEGSAGRPRLKPPYPPQSGLFGRPTLINNVETLACVPQIVLNGAKWYRSFGTPSSPGTKVFCLVGDVNRRSMVELPMGVTVRQVLYGFGGGIRGGRELKMVQTGGLTGTFFGPDKLDVPLDYDSMKNHGVSLGSGVILAVDDSHCVVDIALNVMEFYKHESCGKCTPCREGTRLACEILERMTRFEATSKDLDYLEQIAQVAADASFCGLGQGFNVPLLSLIQNFRGEFLEHTEEKVCRVGICKPLKKRQRLTV